MSRIQNRLPLEVYEQVFCVMLSLAEEHKLLSNKTVAVDSTYLEANVAIQTIDFITACKSSTRPQRPSDVAGNNGFFNGLLILTPNPCL